MWKCCTQYASKFGKFSRCHRTGKGKFSFQFQRNAMSKNAHITIQLHSFHMPARLCSKSFKPGFSTTWSEKFQMYKLDLEKAEEPEIKLPTSTVSSKKQEFQKKIYFCFTDYAMHLTVCITTNCGKFSMRWEYQTTLPVSWETCIQDKQQQLELDMEQRTGSKLGKE